MTSKWLEIRLTVPDRAVDLVSQRLVELGSTGVTLAVKELDTFIVPDPDSLDNDPQLKAYFRYPDQLEPFCQTLHRELEELMTIYPELAETVPAFREVDDHDWASDWQQHFPPFRVGDRLVIRPSWVDWPTRSGEVVLTLDPGQAFGTGTHATTSLCLDVLAEHFASDQPPRSLLDVGTGSGILAMAGAALGAEQVIACDIDSAACQVARDNVAQNDLAQQVSITDAPLEDISGRYDLVLANILAAENIRLADALVAHLAAGGWLVLSGILVDQEPQVLDAFASFPLTLLSTNHKDEWSCIVYRRHE